MLNYQTIREQVANHLRNKILQMEILPGERVLEQDIADELSISRGPVRESLRQLEQEGLLEYRRNRGCIVRKFEKKDAAEVFFLRSTLEVAAIEVCDGKIDSAILAEMKSVLERIGQACEREDKTAFFEQDEAFHALLVRACGLPRLFDLWNSLSAVGFAIVLTDKRQNFDLSRQYRRHVELYEALSAGDAQKAKEAISGHYMKTSELYSKE